MHKSTASRRFLMRLCKTGDDEPIGVRLDETRERREIKLHAQEQISETYATARGHGNLYHIAFSLAQILDVERLVSRPSVSLIKRKEKKREYMLCIQ